MIRDSPKVNVWCCVMVDSVIGSFFFCRTQQLIQQPTKLCWSCMHTTTVWPSTVIFQQDGAPPHWALEVRRALDKTFPAHWIGWGGPIAWPPRSPDMTPLDFFLWGHVKDQIHSTRVIDLDDLKGCHCHSWHRYAKESMDRVEIAPWCFMCHQRCSCSSGLKKQKTGKTSKVHE